MKNTIIIIDGLDASGKTTLCEKIKTAFPSLPVIKETKDTDYEAYNPYAVSAIKDRSFLSEYIFSSIFNRTSRINYNQLKKYIIAAQLNHNVLFVIAVNGSHGLFKKIHTERGETTMYDYETTKRKWDALARDFLYWHIHGSPTSRVMYYDISKSNNSDKEAAILKWVKENYDN